MHRGDHPLGIRGGATARRQPGKQNLGTTIGNTASPLPRRRTQKKRATAIHPDALKREISVALLVKLALLFAIWLLFFRDPLARSLNSNDMDRVLLGSAANAPVATVHLHAREPSAESRYEP